MRSRLLPEPAYLQLKDISGAASDYTERLIAEYEEDVASAHQLLGPDAASAQLVGVDVDAAYAHWVAPGRATTASGTSKCRTPGAVHGRRAGTLLWDRVDDLLAGEWYIVHLGAVLRPGDGGTVDDPQSGPGVPSYSSTAERLTHQARATAGVVEPPTARRGRRSMTSCLSLCADPGRRRP